MLPHYAPVHPHCYLQDILEWLESELRLPSVTFSLKKSKYISINETSLQTVNFKLQDASHQTNLSEKSIGSREQDYITSQFFGLSA